jgi:hypothetical protein
MGEQVVLLRRRDATVGEKRGEAGYVGGQQLNSKSASFAERTVPFDGRRCSSQLAPR